MKLQTEEQERIRLLREQVTRERSELTVYLA